MNKNLTDNLPPAYLSWVEAADALMIPVISLMKSGVSELPIEGPASDHDANADRLEAFARPCLLAAFWLQARHPQDRREQKNAVAAWFRNALLQGSDPESSHYWGPNASYHQNGVEMGLLVIALKVAATELWDPLGEAEKHQVGRWMASNRATGHHWNNHLFFGVFALEFLQDIGMGRSSDRVCIEKWFAEMELMYRGKGWFMDGMNQSYDHYNAYAFHFYGFVWSWLYGARDLKRAQRWTEWGTEFLTDYQYMFAASGEHPAFGRSIAYRFNASAPFAAGVLVDALPFAHGKARRLLRRNLDFFLEKSIAQTQGALSLGWHDAFPELAEKYSCAGSPYWAVKSLIALLIPPDHDFWSAEEEPLESEKEDQVICMPEAGLIVRTVGGEVELLNAGSCISPVNKEKFGPWKWGKLAYRTGVGFTIGRSNDAYSFDAGLTAMGGEQKRIYGRHFTTPLQMDTTSMLVTYSLGDKYEQINSVVETAVWWNRGWLLVAHGFDNYQALRMSMGGFSLASRDPESFSEIKSVNSQAWWTGERGVVLQPICGADSVGIDQRRDDSVSRIHVQAPWHVTPLMHSLPILGEGFMAALIWAGSDKNESQPWQIDKCEQGQWQLTHPTLGGWHIGHPLLQTR